MIELPTDIPLAAKKVLATHPPIKILSVCFIKLFIAVIFSFTFDPPTIARNGLLGFVLILSKL